MLLALAAAHVGLADEPAAPAELPEGWYARIETTKGIIVAQLLVEQAPTTVAHFAALANGELSWVDPIRGDEVKFPYFDGIAVAKVEAGRFFEISKSRLDGRPAPRVYVPLEGQEYGFNLTGAMGMIGLGRARYSAATFFVAVTPMPWLRRNHPCFARIVQGLEVARAITEIKLQGGHMEEPVIINRVRVFPVGEPAPLPEPVPYTPQLREVTAQDEFRP